MRRAVFALAALVPVAAAAAEIVQARFDARANELVVEIAYRGTQPDHDFALQWGDCEPGGEAVARLVDRQGEEPAREGFRAQARFDLATFPCRPARLTVRLGVASLATVALPTLRELTRTR